MSIFLPVSLEDEGLFWFVLCLVTQSCLTFCSPVVCSLPCSSVHEIFLGRILEWVAISFSKGSFRPRDWAWVSTSVSCIGRQISYHQATWKACSNLDLWFLNVWRVSLFLFYLAAPGLSCNMQYCNFFSCGMQILSCSLGDLVPWPGIEPEPSALGIWSLSHWTAREVLVSLLIIGTYML